jgi:hypothetical protein
MLPSVSINCPYCGETIELLVDALPDELGGGQRYIEDCQVCCRPITVSVSTDADGELRVDVAAEDDT